MSKFNTAPRTSEQRSFGPRGHPADAALLTESAWQAIAASLQLSGRELEIVRAIFNGQKETAIAARLGVTPRTVHTHVERMYRKLDGGE
jgi:DNA-binding NarL/FixJ family response regulator